mgnify:CR=1 FL=1|jgi:hypothetical protein
MEVEWSDSSYAANAKIYPRWDYELLKANTYLQKRTSVAVPFLRAGDA